MNPLWVSLILMLALVAGAAVGIFRPSSLCSRRGPDTVERVAGALALHGVKHPREEFFTAQGYYLSAAEEVVAAVGPVGRPEKPTHICLDCGAVGHSGGYHDHGNGNAGDTCTIAELLRIVAEAGAVADERDELRESVGRSCEVTDETRRTVDRQIGFAIARMKRVTDPKSEELLTDAFNVLSLARAALGTTAKGDG